MDITDSNEWRIEIVSVEVGQFEMPKNGQLKPGKKWFVQLSDGTGTYGYKLVTFDEDYPDLTEEQEREHAKEYFRLGLSTGWRPNGQKGVDKLAETQKMTEVRGDNLGRK